MRLEKFFNDKSLETQDSEIFVEINNELQRQQNSIELIASENIVSEAILQAQGSILTNKYAEGYAGRRYYGGCEYVDNIEVLAINRLKEVFGCKFANVQPHSGSQANMAVFMALMNAGDSFLGMDLNSGGHLTHGSPVSFSGKLYKPYHYFVDKKTQEIDYAEVEKIALQCKPKLIIAGGSAYSRIINFKKFREIADKVGAYLMVDMAHFAGLVAGGMYLNPIEYADVVTSTTHKTLRGPRGGIILTNNAEIMKKVNSAVFPGIQGGPLMHVIAAKAVAFKEALSAEYKTYISQVVKNAQAMANQFIDQDCKVVSNGTDTHLFMVDVTSFGLNGKDVEEVLDSLNITCNKNSLPFDILPPTQASGIRIGTPAVTSRGFKEEQCIRIVNLIIDILKNTNPKTFVVEGNVFNRVTENVLELCAEFPIYRI